MSPIESMDLALEELYKKCHVTAQAVDTLRQFFKQAIRKAEKAAVEEDRARAIAAFEDVWCKCVGISTHVSLSALKLDLIAAISAQSEGQQQSKGD